MTTPTTPAADEFDAWYEALPSMCMPEREFALFTWNAATARESALVAERDALRAAVEDAADEWARYVEVDTAPRTLTKHMLAAFDAALAAPAVEGV